MLFKKQLFLSFNTGSSASAVTLLQVEDFPSGIGGWTEVGPSPNDPAVITGGGSDGSDHLGNISAGGGGAGSKMLMFNTSTLLTGNYACAGITGIQLSARNAGAADPINLRVAFNGAGGWFISDSLVLAPGSSWASNTFDISSTGLTCISGGIGNYGDILGAALSLRFCPKA